MSTFGAAILEDDPFFVPAYRLGRTSVRVVANELVPFARDVVCGFQGDGISVAVPIWWADSTKLPCGHGASSAVSSPLGIYQAIEASVPLIHAPESAKVLLENADSNFKHGTG